MASRKTMKTRKKRISKPSPNKRNPADVKAGIDASRIGMGRTAQRTASRQEMAANKGTSKTQQTRERATRAATPGAVGEREKRVTQQNIINRQKKGIPLLGSPKRGIAPIPGATPEQTFKPALGQPEAVESQNTPPLTSPEAKESQITETAPEQMGQEPPARSLFKNFLDFQQQSRGIPTGASMKDLAKGAGVSLAAGVAIAAIATGVGTIASSAGIGTTLAETGGLSNPTVAKIASGGSAGRLAKATEYIAKTYPKQSITTKAAKSVLSYLGKTVKTHPWKTLIGGTTAITGIVGQAVFNGFLDEEADQSISFAIDQAIRNGFMDEAKEMIEWRKGLTDKGMWNTLQLLYPMHGINNYMTSAQAKIKQQEHEFEIVQRTLIEGYTPTNLEQAKREEEEEYYASRKTSGKAVKSKITRRFVD